MPHDLWKQLASSAGRELSAAQEQQFDRYLDLLAEANQRMNLTRIVDREQASVAHIGDALTLLPFIPVRPLKLADIGSGGGVPGIPLAIALPDAQITLVESTNKKAQFLLDCVRQLGLANVKVLPNRAEDVARTELRETLDVVTARAVGELAFLIEWCMPLLKKGGRVLAMKGAKAQEEIAAAEAARKLLNASEAIVHPVALPGAEHHVIVEMIKIGRSNDRFPRPATVAKSRPLK
jgi:16S rRNA (guanine527-N7)-methyltransferase